MNNRSALLMIMLLATANAVSAADFAQKEQVVTSITKTHHGPHSRQEIFMRGIQDKEGHYELRVKGQGKYARFNDVTWVSVAQIFFKDEILFVGWTRTQVFSRDKKVFESTKSFSDTFGRVLISIKDGEGRIVRSVQYPIRGPICDDVTMAHVLPFFTRERQVGRLKSFYLVTNEPKLYHVMVKSRGEERLPLLGHRKASKYQLMADLGPLTETASRLVPPTFLWYSGDPQVDWRQYEGMESGYKSANIISYVSHE